jgi:hypothetical protein
MERRIRVEPGSPFSARWPCQQLGGGSPHQSASTTHRLEDSLALLHLRACYGTERDGVVAAVSTDGSLLTLSVPEECVTCNHDTEIEHEYSASAEHCTHPSHYQKTLRAMYRESRMGFVACGTMAVGCARATAAYALNPKRSLSIVCIAPPPPIPTGTHDTTPTSSPHSLLFLN